MNTTYANGRFRAVIFDLDGTLLDTLADIAACTNRWLAAKGHPTHPADAYRAMIGKGAAYLIRNALPEGRRTDAEIAEGVAAYQREYAAHGDEHTRAFDGVPELLDALTARGMKLAVLSNKPEPLAVQCIKQFLAKWEWAAVIGALPHVPVKPDPAMPRRVVEMLGIEPSAVAYLGDTEVDMQTARTAGMHGIGVTWGMRSRQELEAGGAAAIVERPPEALRLIAP